eukprot:jgi/Astpho2/8028/fgenesh1_pg.00120_%23_22_t
MQSFAPTSAKPGEYRGLMDDFYNATPAQINPDAVLEVLLDLHGLMNGYYSPAQTAWINRDRDDLIAKLRSNAALEESLLSVLQLLRLSLLLEAGLQVDIEGSVVGVAVVQHHGACRYQSFPCHCMAREQGGCSLTCAPLLALARLSIAEEAVALQQERRAMAPKKRKAESPKRPGKPKAAPATKAAPASEEDMVSLDVSPEVCAQVLMCVGCGRVFGDSVFTMHLCGKGSDCQSSPMAAVCPRCLGDDKHFRCNPCKVTTPGELLPGACCTVHCHCRAAMQQSPCCYAHEVPPTAEEYNLALKALKEAHEVGLLLCLEGLAVST